MYRSAKTHYLSSCESTRDTRFCLSLQIESTILANIMATYQMKNDLGNSACGAFQIRTRINVIIGRQKLFVK